MYMELQRKNLKYVKTVGQHDYYLAFEIGEDITSAKLQGHDNMVCIDNTTEDGRILRQAHKMPGNQVSCMIRDNYEGTPQIINLLIKSIADDKEIFYRDDTTGAEVRIGMTSQLAGKHLSHLASLADEGFCRNIQESIQITAEGHDSNDMYRDIEKQEIRKRVSDHVMLSNAKADYSRQSSATRMFDAFSRKAELEGVPRDLFVMYAIIYRPSLGRDINTGEKTYLPSLFKDAEEEATFMRTLINHSETKDVGGLTLDIMKAVPGISKEASIAIANAFVKCSASDRKSVV